MREFNLKLKEKRVITLLNGELDARNSQGVDQETFQSDAI